MTRTVESFPTREERDPRTDPRIGDVFSDGTYRREIVMWGRGDQCYQSQDWTPPADVSLVRYHSRRSSSWMPWDRWMAWAATATVEKVTTNPTLDVRWHEQQAGVVRVEQDGPVRTLHFKWGSALVGTDGVVTLHEHDGTRITGCRIKGHRWTPMEIAILYFGTTHGVQVESRPFRLRLVEDEGEE